MEKKKILRRAALFGAIAFIVGAVGLTILELNQRARHRERERLADERVVTLRKEYQAYLDQTARKIETLPADPRILGEIQARHYRESPRTWQYVWATTNAGEFSFGVPADAFTRLNAAWDHHRSRIARDNHYASRDQFLRALLHHDGRIALTPSEETDDADKQWRRENDWWRFREARARHDDGSTVVYLSSPILDAQDKSVGSLNLKVVEFPDERRRREFFDRDGEHLFAMTMVASFFWLWFLVPTWVYIDARERGMARPILWAFLTLIGNVFALMVYLISRPPLETKELRCPKCAKALNGAKTGCPYCGADLSSAFCGQCQYPLKPDWGFCPACRTPVGATTPPTPAPSVP